MVSMSSVMKKTLLLLPMQSCQTKTPERLFTKDLLPIDELSVSCSDTELNTTTENSVCSESDYEENMHETQHVQSKSKTLHTNKEFGWCIAFKIAGKPEQNGVSIDIEKSYLCFHTSPKEIRIRYVCCRIFSVP